MKKLAFLVSNVSPGSNLRRVIRDIERDNLHAIVAVVISDAEDSAAIKFAKKKKIPTVISRNKNELIHLLTTAYPVDYVVLAGWRKIIPDEFLDIFEKRILNVHPGIIPNDINTPFLNPDGTTAIWGRGKLTANAIKEVIDSHTTYAGATVHFLSKDFDFGPVLERCFEKVNPSDTIDSLYRRLKKKENTMYINVLRKLCN